LSACSSGTQLPGRACHQLPGHETGWGTKSLDAIGSTAFVFTPPKGTKQAVEGHLGVRRERLGPGGTRHQQRGKRPRRWDRPTIAGTVYLDALGVHSPSKIRFYLGAGCRTFTALTGLDDEAGAVGSSQFTVADSVSPEANRPGNRQAKPHSNAPWP
jgi:alpha-galactosidase